MGPWEKRLWSEFEFVKNFKQLRDCAARILRDVDAETTLLEQKIQKLEAERDALQARLDFKED